MAGDTSGPKLLPARSPLLACCCRTASLLLLHGLFPEHTSQVLGWAAVPVAVADMVATIAQALPAAGQEAVTKRLRGRWRRKGKGKEHKGRAWDGEGDGAWLDKTLCTGHGVLHALRCLSGEARGSLNSANGLIGSVRLWMLCGCFGDGGGHSCGALGCTTIQLLGSAV